MAESIITADALHQALTYNPETGIFTRLRDSTSSVGRITTKGYRQVSIAGTRAMAHRLAWLYMHGEWPTGQVDHVNQNKDDNRISNLRVVSNKQNGENITLFKHNTSGFRGVRWHARTGKWIAEIKHLKRSRHLGCFDDIEDAISARAKAEKALFTHAPSTQEITQVELSG